jgi:hypothetical protein
VIDHVFAFGLRQTVEMAGHELAVMLDGRGYSMCLGMIQIVGRYRAYAMRADGNDLRGLALLECLQISFGELLEHQIVAQPTSRIACAFLFLQDAERGAEMLHHAGEGGDDLAALRIVSAHAAQPETVLLGAVENRKLFFGDELVAFGRAESQRIAIAFEGEKQLGAVAVFPLAGVHRAAAEPYDDRKVFDADRALIFARAAGGALERGFLREMFAEERLSGGGTELVQIIADA